MSTGPDPLVDLPKLFHETSRIFERWMDAHCEKIGTSPARARLMSLLHCGGSQRMTCIAGALGVSPRNVTALVDGLEADGFAEREPHPVDRRATMVRLTEAGLKWAKQNLCPLFQQYSSAFAKLPQADRVELARLLSAVRETLEEHTSCGGDKG